MISFEQYLQQKGFIPQTIARHHREIKKYNTWLDEKQGKNSENATKKDLLNYLQHVKQSRGICNATQSKILEKIKNYYRYLAKEHGINDITHLIKIRGINRKHLHHVFTPEELELLCEAYYYHVQEYTPNKKELRFYPDYEKLMQGRYIALTLVAYQALQVHEIQALAPDNFDFRKATVTIHESRAGAERKLSLDASQMGSLIHYYSDGEESPIMPTPNQFENLRKTLKTLHPKYKDLNQVRASRVTHWIKLYGLRKAQYLAGHKSINNTERYLSNDIETLQNDMDHFHPLK